MGLHQACCALVQDPGQAFGAENYTFFGGGEELDGLEGGLEVHSLTMDHANLKSELDLCRSYTEGAENVSTFCVQFALVGIIG